MATAVAQGTRFDPYHAGLGPEVGVPRFCFGEVPFGAILRAERANGTIYAVYSTEHTTVDYLEELWVELGRWGLTYHTFVQCKRVPPDFAKQAKKCYIHYYTTHKRGLLVGINKTQFFAAQGVF